MPLPQVGSPAPTFKLPSSTGQVVDLSALKGKRVVLYFYPKADTPGCTVETCAFRDSLPRFDTHSAVVLGISPDPVEDVTKFAKKFNVPFALVADADHSVAEAYGVWGPKKFMGREYMGAARTTFVIDKDGKIEHVFEKVKPEGHEKQVLDYLAQAKA